MEEVRETFEPSLELYDAGMQAFRDFGVLRVRRKHVEGGKYRVPMKPEWGFW